MATSSAKLLASNLILPAPSDLAGTAAMPQLANGILVALAPAPIPDGTAVASSAKFLASNLIPPASASDLAGTATTPQLADGILVAPAPAPIPDGTAVASSAKFLASNLIPPPPAPNSTVTAAMQQLAVCNLIPPAPAPNLASTAVPSTPQISAKNLLVTAPQPAVTETALIVNPSNKFWYLPANSDAFPRRVGDFIPQPPIIGHTKVDRELEDSWMSLISNCKHAQLMLADQSTSWTERHLFQLIECVGDGTTIITGSIQCCWAGEPVYEANPGARSQISSGVLTYPVIRMGLLEVQSRSIAGSGDQQYGSGIVAEADDQASKPLGDLDYYLISPSPSGVSIGHK
ncbi:uncharacterized protein LOC120427932 [Culex pipiens pallens]|uniref:uncharacterized protein LOC120427932 n=1 Tax=Culex pipiens pallens TaxID=42434 RepID=UPI0022AA09AB|nr:uncharacterized protein LOC120427932 [Culex pipiens pallens]XP_039448810.2 uncharacterized protein LOC120427932 [Culex pipiens pallens]XP_039448811.2 uncharacterized protein LOC120427932 [Culex pipiens pallens]XP_052566758.1 uncharacterized protein LOC120427932 [Culex pipiens pallens]XP_052566759.1 uncharacterized protein LOC120427932 [Culex pipiens pallens]